MQQYILINRNDQTRANNHYTAIINICCRRTVRCESYAIFFSVIHSARFRRLKNSWLLIIHIYPRPGRSGSQHPASARSITRGSDRAERATEAERGFSQVQSSVYFTLFCDAMHTRVQISCDTRRMHYLHPLIVSTNFRSIVTAIDACIWMASNISAINFYKDQFSRN